MKCYWWRPEPDWPRSADAAAHLRGPRVRNFGDEITEFLLKQMGISYDWASPRHFELLVTGSVLEHLLRHSWAGTVCGAGKLHERSRIHFSDARGLRAAGQADPGRVPRCSR